MSNESDITDNTTLAPEPDFLNEAPEPDFQNEAPEQASGIFQRADGRVIESLVLNEASQEDLPTSPTACQVCPNSMWLQEDDNGEVVLQNYCMIMHRIIWHSNKPAEVLNCDGLVMNLDDE